MNNAPLLHAGWMRTKQHAPSVIAAALIYGGIYQTLEQLQYALSNCVVVLVNFILRQGFREQTPLVGFGPMPWVFRAKMLAVGVIVMVVGTFVGLWVQARSRRQLAP